MGINTKHLQEAKKVLSGILYLGVLWFLASPKPPIEWLSEHEGFMNFLPWILFVLALAIHFNATKPNAIAEGTAVLNGYNNAKFIYQSIALLFLMMFCKECNDIYRLIQFETREHDGMIAASSSGFDTNAIHSIQYLEAHKNDPWELGCEAARYEASGWYALSVHFFKKAEESEESSTSGQTILATVASLLCDVAF